MTFRGAAGSREPKQRADGLTLPTPVIPLRAEPWPIGGHAARPCPVCGDGWVPWAGSLLPCHGRCLYDEAGQDALLAHPAIEADLARLLGVTGSIVRSARHAAIRRQRGRR